MPSVIQHSQFMNDTKDKLLQDVKENTAIKYIKDLYFINGNKPFRNLSFLKSTENVLSKLENRNLATSTKKNYIASILSVLSKYLDKKGIEPLYKQYADIMEELREKMSEANPDNTKTDKQVKNWMTWDEIIEKRNKLENSIRENLKGLKFKDLDKRTHYNKLLNVVVLSLYTLIPPRRNDYAEMEIVMNESEATNDKMNYLVLNDKKFIFNNYKTEHKFGKQVIDIPKDLMNVIKLYIRYHPLLQTKKKNYPVHFLVMDTGKAVSKNNGITRILNRIFGDKTIGSSLLRHIFLTDRYGDVLQEKSKIAEQMAHSINIQNEYIVPKTENE